MLTESTFDPQVYPMFKHIVHWPIDELVLCRNANTHAVAPATQIGDSIAASTKQSPLLVDADTVITGGVCLRATRDIGLRSVPVIEIYHGECHAN